MPTRLVKAKQQSYQVACSLGENNIIAHFFFDKKNNSIHFHLYGEIFGKGRAPIDVRYADGRFPDGKDFDVIRKVIAAYSPVEGVQVRRVAKLDEKEDPVAMKNPRRVIVRFRN